MNAQEKAAEEKAEEEIHRWVLRMMIDYDENSDEVEQEKDKKEVMSGIKKHGNSNWVFNGTYVRSLFDIPHHIPNAQVDKYIMEKYNWDEGSKEEA